jgi:hypothetical protein
MSSIIKSRRIFEIPQGDSSSGSRLTILENNEYKVAYFASVNSATGTITIPTGATILADQFPGGVDAYVSTISSGQIVGENPNTTTGTKVDVTSFNTSGDFVLSATPSSYPVAIIYMLKIKAKDWSNLTTANIIEFENNIDEKIVTGRISGLYYYPMTMFAQSNGTITVGTLYAVPFYIGYPQSFDRIAVGTLGTASSFVRLGIYTDNAGRPDQLLFDSGQLSCAVAGVVEYTINNTLSGIVWVCAVGQSIAPSVQRCNTSAWGPHIGTTSMYSVGGGQAYSQTGITGVLPSSWGTTYTSSAGTAIPVITLRKA